MLILVSEILKQELESPHYSFIQRLAKSTNFLVMAIEKSWIVRIDIWNFWQKTLYIIPATRSLVKSLLIILY